jgi:hypothetical protein
LPLTAIAPNELVYVSIAEPIGVTATSITPGNLNMQQRTSISVVSNTVLETWWGVVPSSGTVAIQVRFSSTARVAAVAFGVTGADTASPFDSMPVTGSGAASPSASIFSSTNTPNDLVIGALTTSGQITPITGPGFTSIDYASSGSGNNYRTIADQYAVEVSPQNSLQVAYSWTGSQNWALVADVVKGG